MSKTATAEATAKPFDSKLGTGRERFLAQVMVHSLDTGWRTPEDFLRHFPARALVESLAKVDDLRTNLLIKAAKVHEKAAPKKSVASGAEDLSIALAEGLCDPKTVLEVYAADDRVRYLEGAKLWAFMMEGAFWMTSSEDPNHDRASGRMTFILERALTQGLIKLEDIGDGMSFREISKRLPPDELQKVVEHALTIGREGKPLTEKNLLDALPLFALTGYVPLELVWHKVVMEKIATPQGFGEGSTAKVAAPPARAASAPPAEKAAFPAPKPAPALRAPEPEEEAPAPVPFEPINVEEDELMFDGGESPEVVADPEAVQARKLLLERLRQLERLPPSHASIPLPILASIESMYAELQQAGNDEDRENAIRDSFPNEGHLRTAMLALIELLDPTIDTAEPLIRDADVDSLVKIVLFEERRRYERAHPSKPPMSLPASRGGRAGPPPAGGRSKPPPPLFDEDPIRKR